MREQAVAVNEGRVLANCSAYVGATWEEIAVTPGPFERGDGFESPCELIVGTGTR
jgi:hypothetical protein